MKGKIDISISDDYAVMSSYNYGFYYGYEFDKKECECGETEEIWGFEVDDNEEEQFRISYEDMEKYPDCPEKWDCEKCLLFGIALYLENKKQVRFI